MARQESDREDLFAEAISLTRRVETSPLPIAGRAASPWIAGWRTSGNLSLYLGPDVVYHWDASARLRRAYCDGFLYRTQGTTLARLHRDRTTTETQLVRHDLTPEELARFRQTAQQHIRECQATLATTPDIITRREPADDPQLLPDLLQNLQRTLTAEPWLAPPIVGKRR